MNATLSAALNSTGRSMCSQCLRAQSACICAWVVTLQPLVQVVILQHPLEERQTKGSARLLHLCLAGSMLTVGEQFDQAQLQGLLYVPDCHTVLLYPDNIPGANDRMQTGPPGIAPALPNHTLPQATSPQRIRLIVLDGTWRKSRKMLHCNPLLQALPRLCLQGLPPSHYRVRKAHRADQLSTLEAAAYALAQLEQDEAKYAPLLAAFDGFIDQLAQYWGGGATSDGYLPNESPMLK